MKTVTSKRLNRAMVGIFGVAGVMHFAQPKVFDAIVPPKLPGSQRFYTYASGVGELALAAGYLHPATRTVTSKLAAAFLVGVFPANVYMYQANATNPKLNKILLARLPLQIPLIALSVAAGRYRNEMAVTNS